MKRAAKFFRQLVRDQRGQDFVEYALMAGFVATIMAIIAPTMISSSGFMQAVFTPILAVLHHAGG